MRPHDEAARLNCERCGLVDSRVAIARTRAGDAGGKCPRCGGTRYVSERAPDAARRNAVKAVRSALNGLDRPRVRAEGRDRVSR